MDPALIDASGDPQRKHPDQHATGAPPFLHSEGKPTLQDHYLAESEEEPTAEELLTLRRVPAHIPWRIFSVRWPLPAVCNQSAG